MTTSIRTSRRGIAALAACALGALALVAPGTASASQQAIAYFGSGSSPGGTTGGEFGFVHEPAINWTGAGGVAPGTLYVGDQHGALVVSRIQRFSPDDGGTPADPADDTYTFTAAWGAGVLTDTDDYEICTVAADCKGGRGLGTNGATRTANSIAVDNDTGLVYASDRFNFRVNVYTATGTFLRSFGWDVVASGPGDTPADEFEICIAADGDLCKEGIPGNGLGQIGGDFLGDSDIAVSQPDGNPATGTVFLLDDTKPNAEERVNAYDLDGVPQGGIAPIATGHSGSIAVDSRGILYINDVSGAPPNESYAIQRYDTANANGGGVGFLAPIPSPPLGATGEDMAVDPDTDGPGPDADTLYVCCAGNGGTRQFDQPGLTAPPSAVADTHGTVIGFSVIAGLAVEPLSGRLIVANWDSTDTGPAQSGIYLLDPGAGVAAASLDSVDGVTASAATLHATVNPGGIPDLSYHLEYSTDGSTWNSTPEVLLGRQTTPQALDIPLDPPAGLEPDTEYQVRLVAKKLFAPPIITPALTFTTLASPPLVETTGAPVRTATTAQLTGRITPRNAPATYHFEWGDQGPCSSNPCTSTPGRAAGAGTRVKLVSEEISGLQPDSAYHFRLVADNGNPGSPVFGLDRTVTTHASDEPLSAGTFPDSDPPQPIPGPPGNDRAWEMVSAPDAGGNRVNEPYAISDDGTRAFYGLEGGAPGTPTGAFNQFFAKRTVDPTDPHEGAWVTKIDTYPPRADLASEGWASTTFARSDLASYTAINQGLASPNQAWFRISADDPPVKLFESEIADSDSWASSDDGSRILLASRLSLDPDHPVTPAPLTNGWRWLYDVAGSTPRMVNLLPGDVIAPCGDRSESPLYGSPDLRRARTSHWISADGDLAFFYSSGATCGGDSQLYARDLVAGDTRLISLLPGESVLSGPTCSSAFIKSNASSVFFWTLNRLDPADSVAPSCAAGGDVYRYDLEGETFDCVTCVAGTDGVVGTGGNTTNPEEALSTISVAEDGSRVYFQTAARLRPGAEPNGLYRVNVADNDLAYVGVPTTPFRSDAEGAGTFLSPDGKVLVFRSGDATLNELGPNGSDNAGTDQYYRYDDEDRSLTCVSCPQDGTPAVSDVRRAFVHPTAPNSSHLSAEGDVFAFSSTAPLVAADTNTAAPAVRGTDAYEWRDGRVLLLSDGETSWEDAAVAPRIESVTPSGNDILFTAAARYTADAVDDFTRLYDARIGGGFKPLEVIPPCPLEDCQGPPSPVPSDPDALPGSGPGNQGVDRTPPETDRCRKGFVVKKGKCVKKKGKKKKHSKRGRRK